MRCSRAVSLLAVHACLMWPRRRPTATQMASSSFRRPSEVIGRAFSMHLTPSLRQPTGGLGTVHQVHPRAGCTLKQTPYKNSRPSSVGGDTSRLGKIMTTRRTPQEQHQHEAPLLIGSKMGGFDGQALWKLLQRIRKQRVPDVRHCKCQVHRCSQGGMLASKPCHPIECW